MWKVYKRNQYNVRSTDCTVTPCLAYRNKMDLISRQNAETQTSQTNDDVRTYRNKDSRKIYDESWTTETEMGQVACALDSWVMMVVSASPSQTRGRAFKAEGDVLYLNVCLHSK